MAGSRPSAARSARRAGNLRPAAAAAVIALSLAIAACGDDEKDSGGLSRAELVEQADPICKRHNATITAASSKLLAGGQIPDPKKFGQFAQQTIVPETSAQTMELRALKPADDVASEYRGWLDASDATVEKIQANPAVVTDAANFKDVNARADKLGLAKQCHIGPS